MLWFILSITSVLALATAELLQQRLLNKRDAFSEQTSGVLTFFFQAILSLPIFLFISSPEEMTAVFQPDIFFRLVLLGTLASIGMRFYLRSFKVKSISFSAIFGSISVVVSTVLGIIFFQETTHVMKFIGIALVLSAIVLLNYRNVHLERNHFYSLLSGIIFGVCFTLDKSIVTVLPLWVFVFWNFLIVSLIGFLMNAKHIVTAVKGKPLSAYKLIIVSGIAYFIYNLCTFSAYQVGGEVGKVDAINNTAVFFIIAFEYLILMHKMSIKRKVFAAIIAYIGIALLGLF